MKILLVMLGVLGMLNAQASYFEDNCANADGTANWLVGHNENLIYFKKSNFETGETSQHQFYSGDVEIKLTGKKTIKKKKTSGPGWAGADIWYSVTATVTPNAEIKEEFKKIFPKGKFKDYVICHDQWSGETGLVAKKAQ